MKKINSARICRVSPCIFLLMSVTTLLFAQSMTEGFKLKKMDGTAIKWEIEAASAKFGENVNSLHNIKVTFYPKNKTPFTIKADEGYVKDTANFSQKKKSEIYVEKNVRILGYLKSDVKCETLSWDSASETMRTKDTVEIDGGKWQIKGKDAEFSSSGDTITIKQNVTMKINEP